MMISSQANAPRFVPTLTEIVQPEELVRQTMAAPPAPVEKAPLAPEKSGPSIESVVHRELDALVRTLVAEQFEILQLSLREEIENSVRHAVAQALNGQNGAPDTK